MYYYEVVIAFICFTVYKHAYVICMYICLNQFCFYLTHQAECEELQARVEKLNNENRNLREELQKLSEECEKLTSDNSSIKVNFIDLCLFVVCTCSF